MTKSAKIDSKKIPGHKNAAAVGPILESPVLESTTGGASASNPKAPLTVFRSPVTVAVSDLDQLCVHFALQTVLELGPKFNLRRDINNLVTLSARHWVWPIVSLEKMKRFIERRCAEVETWAGVESLTM